MMKMIKLLRDGLEGRNLKAILYIYICGLVVLAPAAAVMGLLFGAKTLFKVTPLLAVILVGIEYGVCYLSTPIWRFSPYNAEGKKDGRKRGVSTVKTIEASFAHEHLPDIMTEVCENSARFVIKRHKNPEVVVISYHDYLQLIENKEDIEAILEAAAPESEKKDYDEYRRRRRTRMQSNKL